MPILTYEQVLNRLAERTSDNTKQLRKQVQQRRNGMEDLYGTVFSSYGDANEPATFYVSLSPNYVYLEMFAFKFVIKPFVTTVQGGTESALVTVDNTSLLVNNNNIEPNPHTHETQPHTHNVISGKSFIHTVSDYFRVEVAGIDITAYLREQHDNAWIEGEGIYPNNRLDDMKTDFYDILDVAVMKNAEGATEDAEALLAHDFKEVKIYSDAPFAIDAYLYLRYSHVNR